VTARISTLSCGQITGISRIWGVMATAKLHLIKLCVGAETVEDLTDWQARVMAEARAAGRDPLPVHVTRMWPKRADDLLAGGSLYWVIKGFVLCRQRILALEPRDGTDGVRRCAIRLDPETVRTRPQPRRPFQGWRYLRPEDAPRDLAAQGRSADLPPALVAGLDAIGVL
jgi:hypothetical protein